MIFNAMCRYAPLVADEHFARDEGIFDNDCVPADGIQHPAWA